MKRVRYYSNPGDPIHIKYQLQLMTDGSHDVVPVDKEDVRDIIESHQDACDINILMERYKHGDTEALNKCSGYYFDSTDMPTDAFEVYRMVQNGRYHFDHLPVDVRAKFNHNFDEFVASLGTDRFERIMSGRESVPEVKEEKVNESEQ